MTADRPTFAVVPGSDTPRLSPRVARRIVISVFVAGIVGMIVSSIANATGASVTFGLITAVAAIGLVLVTSVTPAGSLAKSDHDVAPVVDESLAADLESRIDALVAAGADEDAVRRLVGRAIELGRGR